MDGSVTMHVPTMNCIFHDARRLSKSSHLMYANSDILFFDDLPPLLAKVG